MTFEEWPPTSDVFGGYPPEGGWIEVGDRNWLSKPQTTKDGTLYSWWAHRTMDDTRNDLGRIVYGGSHHQLVSEDPLHIEPSLLCVGDCGMHGWVRDGKWSPA